VPKWVQDYLEEAGYELEYSDEWFVDYNYDKAYRTVEDSYHWQCQIHFTDIKLTYRGCRSRGDFRVKCWKNASKRKHQYKD
jgi:hypothetical protein